MTPLPIKKRLPYLSVLLAFCLILGYVESLMPFDFAIPGMKIGLSNLPVIITLYLFTPYEALMITLTKAVLTGLLFGNMSMIIYSVSGALLSCLSMICIKKVKKIHVPTVSCIGGIMHNVGQIIVAFRVVETGGIFYYLPFLALSGAVTGFALGYLAGLILKPVGKIIYKGEQI